jgi:hypothetical protein
MRQTHMPHRFLGFVSEVDVPDRAGSRSASGITIPVPVKCETDETGFFSGLCFL